MSEQTELPPGPDLAAGIAASALEAGGMLAGRVGREPVLLARRGDTWFAIGATCSHYGGPLAEGIMVGDTVRCPWHHACFDLRTGRALRGPALNDVACYRVARRDGMIHVDGVVAPPPPPAMQSDAPRRVVIVGGGAAGNAAAEMLRREGYDGSITMIDPDADAPCDRPNLSKDYLAGNAPEEWIPLHPPEFYAEHRIDIVRSAAERIDRSARQVMLDGGRALPYDALLLATGAEPVHLTMPTAGPVHYLRSLADSRALIRAAAGQRRAVVIGAGFIGLEVAASLRARGLEVHVVAPDEVPLGRLVGPELGAVVQREHERHGVVFHLGHKPAAIAAGCVTLEDGTELEADLVVVGVGVTPRMALARAAGLAEDHGVAVNEFLQTSDPCIYAAGDIARWPDPHSGQRIRVEHWVVAERQGQAAARNILGARAPFDAVPFFWSVHFELGITYSGHAESWDEVIVAGDLDRRDALLHYRAAGRTLATVTVAVVGADGAFVRDRQNLRAERAMEERRDPAEVVI